NPNEVYIGASSTFHINYSDFNPLAIDGSYTGFFNINAAPLLVNPQMPQQAPTSAGDYHLTYNSPCKDTGTGLSRTVPSDDIDGDVRPQRGSWIGPEEYDMGSDEYELTFSPAPNIFLDIIRTRR
ncbi:MAG: hypothetical protein GY729_05615, partial [Desulfobacteraceae bacterium]|nr:hypothetical protein [Desulfobacteraceae bacterium]